MTITRGRTAIVGARPLGPRGLAPAHEVDGARIRFQNPDGSFGDYVEAPAGPAGDAIFFRDRAELAGATVDPALDVIWLNFHTQVAGLPTPLSRYERLDEVPDPVEGRHALSDGDTVAWELRPRDTGANILEYGALGSPADDTAAIQAALSSGARRIIVPANMAFECGALTIPNPGTTLEIGPRATLTFSLNATGESPITILGDQCMIGIGAGGKIHTPTLGANTYAFDVQADAFTILGAGAFASLIEGPAANAAVLQENCVKMWGAATNARRSGLIVDGVEIKNFGMHGIHGRYLNNIIIRNLQIHHCGYAGYGFESCDNGRVEGNQIYTITPGFGGNMYGGFLSHDSTGYSTDPNIATPRLVANPFCRGWVLVYNEVFDIHWEGLDCHGGYECMVAFNRIYNTRWGISVPSSSGDATNYAGEQNVCAFNVIDGRNRDGTTSGRENIGYAINLNGGTTVNHRRIVCHGNVIYFKGEVTNENSGAIQAQFCQHAMISGNVMHMWGGNGVLFNGSGGLVANNIIGSVANSDANSACVRESVGSAYPFSIIGNVHQLQGSNRANFGIRTQLTSTFVPIVQANDFREATVPYSLSNGWESGDPE